MKIRYILGLSLALATVAPPRGAAFQKPAQPALPNFDARQATPPPAAALARPQNDLAAAALRAQVNGLRLERDARSSSVRWLGAQRGFLTAAGGAGKGLSQAFLDAVPTTDPQRLVKAFVNEHAALLGHDAGALDQAALKTDARTPASGLRTVIWQQKLDGIYVYGGLFVSHLTRNDELISISDRMVPDLAQAAAAVPNRSQLVAIPPLTAAEAVRRAALDLGDDGSALSVEGVGAVVGAEQKQSFVSPRLAGEGHAQLVWLPLNNGQVRLCWQVILTGRVRPEMYLLLLDAQTGDLVLRRCLTDYISNATYNIYPSDSPSPFTPSLATPSNYQPPILPRSSVTLSAINTNASPKGWIDDGGNETVGNNVDAHLDRDADNQPDLPRPQGNPNRVFNPPLDLSKSPASYGDASVVNLFYWNNFMHDRLYQLGFTEAFGNFQGTNFGRGGVGGDAVQADAQDGSGFNNANFSTPPDGGAGRMQMYLFDGPSPDRDGDLDAEVMCHEYTHGLSNRLLGGGVGISELQPRGMGEGWSDFYAESLLSEPTDDPRATYASGGYASYQFFGLQDNYYFGIRRYPYSTDMSKNPLTLKDIDPTQADAHAGVPISPVIGGSPADEVHAMGEVWCVTLWEARANLIEKLGPTLGNQTMLQLVTDGLKLAPANATFLEARDGIIAADEAYSGGDNLAELWYGFAKRGMGFSATVPTADTTIGVQEAYDVPDYVIVGPPDGVMEVVVTPVSSSALFAGTNQIAVRLTDGSSVTNATIAATVSTGGSLNFRNDGVAPDLTADNAIYTANYVAPNVSTNVTLTLVISAPEKDTATNVINYLIVPVPPNDNFTNAAKVAPAGGSFITNNKRATTEPGEPVHAGVQSVAASLWWNFTPAADGSVLIDTAGSTFNTVLAVYTNNTLATLQPVVSADDVGARQQAFVFLPGKAGVTYRIAAASYDANSTGTLRLTVTPGGIPDTNAPSVTISSPLSGLTFLTNRIFIVGTAIDPDPNPSGLRQVEIRVSRGASSTTWGDVNDTAAVSDLISTNWTKSTGLFEGLNIIQISVKDVAGNRSTPATLQATYRPQDPPNDVFANATLLTGTAGTNIANTLKATKELGEPNHAGNPGGKSAWWKYQPATDGELILSTTNSTFDTLLAVYQGSAVGALTLIAQNDDAPAATDGTSYLAVPVRSNQVYRIAVDGYDAAGGVVFLEYAFTPATIYRLTVNAGAGGSVTPGSQDVKAGNSVTITANPNSGYLFNQWSGDVVALANPVAVVMNGNRTVTANFSPVTYTDGFESGNFSALGWTTGGASPWLVEGTNVAAGNFAARSGVIGPSQNSSLFLSRNFRSGVGSFDFRVSSEAGWDILSFRLDGTVMQQWSGELSWTTYSFPVTVGTHTLEWRYAKDANNNAGFDGALIDNVNLPLVVPFDASTPATLTAQRQTDGLVFINLTGQVNQTYQVQASTDLQTWTTISTVVLVNGSGHVLDPDSLTNPARYYRAVATAP